MKLNHALRAAACALPLALLLACSHKQEQAAEPRTLDLVAAKIAAPDVAAPEANMIVPPPPPPPKDSAVTTATAAQQLSSNSISYHDGVHKFIRTANARFAVKDVYVAALGIEDTVAGHGGFMVKNDITTQPQRGESHPVGDGKRRDVTEYAVNGKLTLRVPSARTQEFLRAIVSHVEFLDERHFSAHDVQFDLLRQQLDLQRSEEAQNALGQALRDGGKLKDKTEAIAALTERLSERDNARLTRLDLEDQIAYSTIELTLYQPTRVVQSERADVEALMRAQRPGFFHQLGEQVRGGWEGLLATVLWLVSVWPTLLFGAAAVLLVRRILGRRRVKAAAPS